MCTCYGKDDAAQGNPSFFLVPSEIIYDVLRIYGFNYCRIIFYEIVDTDATNECEPDTDNWRKAVAYFVSSKSLNHEEANQDGH